MSHVFYTLPIVKFIICDEDEGTHEAFNNQDYDASLALMARLRKENPNLDYELYAEIEG